jgi:hypothetical protein
MADQGRKPIPKSQKQLSVLQQEPYNESGPGFQPTGNPNIAEGLNRGAQTSFKDDSVKPLSIGLEDLDGAVMYYFQNVIKPSVIHNEERLAVPIIYGSPERWKSFQKDGYYRDANGRIMAPLLMFKRNNVEKVRTIANKLDANHPYNYAVSQKLYNSQNAYDKFNLQNNIKPVKQYYATVVPDYVTVTYDCAVFTYYMDQLNKVVEAIQYASDAYWGDPARFKFRAMIDSFSTNVEMAEGQERIAKSEFTIKLNGYIIPDTLQKDLNSVKKYLSKSTINFTNEVVASINDVINLPPTNEIDNSFLNLND